MHRLAAGLVDDLGAAHVVAVLGGVAHRVAHVRETALVHEVDDELQLVHHLEVGELGLVAGLRQGLEARLDQRGDPAAEHRLLPEEVGLGLLGKGGLQHAGASAADASGVGQSAGAGRAGRVLVHGEEAGDTLAVGVGPPDQVAGPLGRHHADVHPGGGVDQLVADVEAVGEHQHVARLEVGCDGGVVERPLAGVRDQHHDHIGLGTGVRGVEDAQPLGLGRRPALARLGETDPDVVPGVAQVEGVGVALRAVAEDGDLLPLQGRRVGVGVVVHAGGHRGVFLRLVSDRAAAER